MQHRTTILFVMVLLSPAVNAGEKTLFPRTQDEIKVALKGILNADAQADEKTRALQRLKAYRYLVEIPYDDVTLDDELNKACLAGAKLCEKLGRLEHRPKNPDLPEDEFKLAFKGTSQSNLAQGYRNLVEAVDGWLDDSDESNIDRLGHRRWCLNPGMMKTGFGRSGEFHAMYSFDNSRKKVPDYDFIAYPARGYIPREFFGAKYAWSVTLNPKKFKAPAKDYAPKVYRANEAGEKTGEPLKLDYTNVDTKGFGVPNCIVFRPASISLEAKSRYLVELDGITRVGKSEPETLRYVVEFFKLK